MSSVIMYKNKYRNPRLGPQLVNIIRDTRNPSLDYQLRISRAEKLLSEGKLVWCINNNTYMTLSPHEAPK